MAKYRWSIDLRRYREWSDQERLEVETFLRAHDVEPRDVAVGTYADGVWVERLGDGSRQLHVWVYRRDDDGKRMRCPNCPSCLEQRLVEVPLRTELPSITTATVRELNELATEGIVPGPLVA